MSLIRTLRKCLTRNPANGEEISLAFKKVLGRVPSREEVIIWERKFLTKRAIERRLTKSIQTAKMACGALGLPDHLEELPNESFVEHVYLNIAGRYPSPAELEASAGQLRSGLINRTNFMAMHFSEIVKEQAQHKQRSNSTWHKWKKAVRTPSFPIMGTSAVMTAQEWRRAAETGKAEIRITTHARFPLRVRHSEIDVSIICSLWRGGDFIERYMDNITSQTIFSDRCELIVIDAASPEGESSVVERYKERFGDRIVYQRLPYRAGIYVAWNVGIGIARGRYLTNANLDDLRRVDSVERQASALDALSYVDVVYDDHLYFTDPNADFEEIVRAGVVSDLPLTTRCNLFKMNTPHNGPMWRSSLHEKVGMFDESYRSAGDYDFWIRASVNGANFYKLNEATVAYYFNPVGLSTAEMGAGIREPRLALQRHGEALIPEAARENPSIFLKRLGLSKWPEGSVTRYEVVQRRMRDIAGRHGPSSRGRS
jgi:glycosyltransferase involved in cell wall biosynthesis